MEGKTNTLAGDRYMMEFKYMSNRKQDLEKLKIAQFKAKAADIAQLSGSCYLIYCFGNRDFRVFDSEGIEQKSTRLGGIAPHTPPLRNLNTKQSYTLKGTRLTRPHRITLRLNHQRSQLKGLKETDPCIKTRT